MFSLVRCAVALAVTLTSLWTPLTSHGTVVVPSGKGTIVRKSAFEYDPASGLLTKEIIEPDDPSLCVATTYAYDGYGNTTSVTTANCSGASGDAVFTARTTTTSYAAANGTNGPSQAGQFPTTLTNALNQAETKQFDIRFGGVTSLTGPNGLTTTWQFDEFGRKTLETRSDGNKTKWEYAYCSGINGGSATCSAVNGYPSGAGVGAWVVTTTPLASDGTTQNGLITQQYFDTLGREYRLESETYSGSTKTYKDTWFYKTGEVGKKSRPYFNDGSPSLFDIIEYDALRRPVKQSSPDEYNILRDTLTTYNGLSVAVTDAKLRTRVTTNNSQGKVVSVKDAYNKVITYGYDPVSNLSSTTDSLGNQVTMGYDLRGRKIVMNDPDLGSWTYSYNALGELVRQTNPKGQIMTMAYDVLGRMTQRSEPDLVSSWYYDKYKNGSACAKGIGKLCQTEASNGYGRVHGYDTYGRLSSTSTGIGAVYSEVLQYDSNGRLGSRTYPTGLTLFYLYTQKGLLGNIRRDSNTGPLLWSPYSLDAEFRHLEQTYGNNVRVTRSYSPTTGRPNYVRAGPGNSILNMTYYRDEVGNVVGRNEGTQNLVETFAYDDLNRMTSSTVNSSGAGVITKNFAYDEIGNIQTRSDFSTAGGYLYNPSGATSVLPHAVNRVNHVAGGYRTFGYDANGNMTSEVFYDANNQVIAGKGRTNTFTSFDMPLTLQADGKSSSFYYGPEHQRVQQNSSTQGTTIYVNPGNTGEVFYEKDFKPNGDTEERQFIHADGRVFAIIKKLKIGGVVTEQTRYLHHDELGSTVAVTDTSGAVVERMAYEPFGKRRFAPGQDDPNNTIFPATTERGFTSHEHLDELRTIHMNGRVYDPLLGRFLTADPFVQSPNDQQSYNRYTYMWNSPLNGTDPSGYINHWWRSAISIAIIYFTGPYQLPATAGGPIGLTGSIYANAALGGFLSGYVNTGNIQGALTSALTATAFTAVGQNADLFGGKGSLGHIAAHGVVGCVSGHIGGGGCGHQAVAAAFAKAATPWINDNLPKNVGVRIAAEAVAGGTASAIGGGKFRNGALTGAYGYLFNHLMHITGGMREGTNPFGHSALAVEGAGLYSYGNSTPLGSDPLSYITDQSLVRDQLITIIPTTSQQDAAAVEFFSTKPGMNSVGILDNCSVRTSQALQVSGVPIDGSGFPGALARQTATLPGVQTFYIPKGGAIPQALVDIIRQKFTPPSVP